MAALEIIHNMDRTVTVRVGKNIETISRDGKTNVELIDTIRWIGITYGVTADEQTIWEGLQSFGGIQD